MYYVAVALRSYACVYSFLAFGALIFHSPVQVISAVGTVDYNKHVKYILKHFKVPSVL